MANPTTNYSWPMPTTTDLVTDLPADFAAFGQPVDTSLKALNPETTLGDISYRSSTANTKTRLAIGSTGQVLSVVAGVPAWASAAGDWTNYTPTITAESGTFTTLSSQAGRYQMINSKTCLVQAVWRVVTVGSAVGKTKFTLPFTAHASAQTAVGSARETESAGVQGWVTIAAAATFGETAKYDNTTFAVNSYTVRAQVVFEVA